VQCNRYTASAWLAAHTGDFRYSYYNRSSAAVCLPRDSLAIRGDGERSSLFLELSSRCGASWRGRTGIDYNERCACEQLMHGPALGRFRLVCCGFASNATFTKDVLARIFSIVARIKSVSLSPAMGPYIVLRSYGIYPYVQMKESEEKPKKRTGRKRACL
jgi:hypothetical protein